MKTSTCVKNHKKWNNNTDKCTGELLYVDKHIINVSKTTRKNVAMACID